MLSTSFLVSLFLKFGQSDIISQFHEQTTWKEKYRVALSLRDPRASFIAKRLSSIQANWFILYGNV